MWAELYATYRGTLEAWKDRESIRSFLKSFLGLFRSTNQPESNQRIAIIGPGGVGKTTLGLILSGEFEWLTDSPWSYHDSFGIETKSLEARPNMPLFIYPGQPIRRTLAFEDFTTDLAAGKIAGIIFCSAHGYHSLHQSEELHPAFTGKLTTFRDDYLAWCRIDEINYLRRLIQPLQSTPRRVWLLSLVTKEDLWRPQRPEVEHALSTGPMGDIIQQIANHRGVSHFRHEWVAATLVISRLLTTDGRIMYPNIEGYDQQHAVESLRRVIRMIAELGAWGEHNASNR